MRSGHGQPEPGDAREWRDLLDWHQRQVRLFDAVASTTPDFVYIFDTSGRFLYANKRLLEVWGMTLEEAVGKTCLELGYQKWHHDMHMAEIAQVIRTGKPVKGQVPFKAPRTGIDGVYEYIFTPVFGPDGSVELIAGTTRDVTERNLADLALRESEQRFRALVTTTSEVIYRMNADWTVLHWLAGRGIISSNDTPIQDWLERHIPADEQEKVRSTVRRAIQVKGVFELEHRILRPDGAEGWVFSRAVPILDGEGRILEWFGAAADITGRKQAETDLAESRRRLELAQAAAALGIHDYDLTTGVIRWDARVRELWGVGADEVITYDTFERGIHPEDRERVRQCVQNCIDSGGQCTFNCEYRVVHRSTGQTRWVAATGRLDARDGRPVRLVGTLQDVTARKEAERALQESEERFRALVLTTSDVTYRLSADWGELLPMDGRGMVASNEEPITDWMERNIPPSEHAAIRERVARAIAERSPFAMEHKVIRPDGSEGWTFSRAVPIVGADGRIVEWFGSAADITERKRNEIALATAAKTLSRERERLELALRTGRLGVYEWRIGDDRVWWSPELYALFGVDPGTFTPTVESFSGLVHPDDREELWRRTEHCLATREVFVHEYRIVRPDGQTRWILNRSNIGLDARGEPDRITGVAADITERREAKDLLRAREEQLRLVANSIPQLAWMARPDGHIFWYNQRWYDYTGTTPEQMEGWGWRSVHDPAELPHVMESWQRSLADGTPWEDVFPLRRYDGQMRWFLSRALPLTDEHGRVTLWFGSNTDITEQRIRERNTELLAEIADALASLSTEDEILKTVGQKLGDRLGLDSCQFDDVDVDNGITTVSHEWKRPGRPSLLGVHRHEDYLTPEILRTARAGIMLVVPDVAAHPFVLGGSFLQLGIASLVLVPSRDRGRWSQAFSVCCTRARVWRDDELELIREVASRVFPRIERARAEAELRRHREHLEALVSERTKELEASHQRLRLAERMASLGTLAAGLGHDIGNILLPLRIRLELLDALQLPETAKEELEGIRSSTDYLQKLASGLRSLAVNVDRSKPTEPTEISAWWAETETVLRTILPRTVQLEGVMHGGTCWTAIAKPALTQAVFNLVQNAGDAMKSTGGVVRITCAIDARNVVLRISDTGPGMTDEVRRRCMEPFFTTKTRGMSTGLGLALVHSLVNEAGGSVDIESAPGKGATFLLKLPRAMPPAVHAVSAHQAIVSITDPRTRAYVIAELKRLKFNVTCDQHDGNVDLAVTDQPDIPVAARRIVRLTPGATCSDLRKSLAGFAADAG